MTTPIMPQIAQPTLSVLVATYQGEAFILEQLVSLTAQTELPFEIVVCDDASNDETVQRVRQFAQTSVVPVRLFRNPKNKGYARNFFDGIEHCVGDYVAFCDQDDVWLPHKLSTLRAVITSQPQIGLVYSDCELVDQQLNSLNQTASQYLRLSKQQCKQIQQGHLFELLIRKPCVTGMTMLVNRHKVMAVDHSFLKMAHDYALSFAFAALGDYIYVDQSLVKYRQHTHNVVGMSKKVEAIPPLKPIEQELHELNLDLVDKINLCVYAKKMLVQHQPHSFERIATLTHLIDFFTLRIQRRHSVVAWCQAFPQVAVRQFKLAERIGMNIKDLKIFFKLKWFNRLNTKGMNED